jgi:GAF domain-containing protein
MKRNNLAFLAEASKILSSSLDYHVTLASTAHLVVNKIADFCIIDIFQPDGKLERVAVKVKEAQYTKLANKMYKFPPNPANKDAIYDTAFTGEPILIKKSTQRWLQSVSQISQEHEVIRKLNLNSHIFVPLKSRGMVIGVLTIASQNPRFSYSKSDLILAQEVGIRAGIAVDKARLYLEAQQAIQARDEFLSIASHELKTPLTSILLHLQAVLANIRKKNARKRFTKKYREYVRKYRETDKTSFTINK